MESNRKKERGKIPEEIDANEGVNANVYVDVDLRVGVESDDVLDRNECRYLLLTQLLVAFYLS